MKQIFTLLCLGLLINVAYNQNLSYEYLDINNVRARFYPVGTQFGILPIDSLHPLGYEVPKNNNTGSIRNCALWIGGMDQGSMFRFAGENARLSGADYWPGPVSSQYDSLYDVKWNRIWRINKATIDDFKANWALPTYVIPQIILDWPAHGNTALNQAYQLAPFVDVDGNGTYSPPNGDYPMIRGDQALFFIFNDARFPHTESFALNLGIEVHGMAYAFDCPGDTAWNNTVFLNYKIYNRSTYNYSDVYAGVFTDLDIGYSHDDYLGCDVSAGLYYSYNGSLFDSIYGNNPPVQALQFIGGPFLDADGIDNQKYDSNTVQLCNESINGLNFGDGIIDNERLGLNAFMALGSDTSGAAWALTDPDSSLEYANMLKMRWKDNTQMLYGGNAHLSNAVGPECRFMYPAETDPCNWGTNGLPPNTMTPNWTEETANNLPGNRRALGRCGPFTMPPGSSQELDLAFIYARSDSGFNASIDSITMYAVRIKKAFINNVVPCSGANISDTYYIVSRTKALSLYPNPSNDVIYIDFKETAGKSVCEVYNLMGDRILTQTASNTNMEKIKIQSLQTGLYLVRVIIDGYHYTLKFVKR